MSNSYLPGSLKLSLNVRLIKSRKLYAFVTFCLWMSSTIVILTMSILIHASILSWPKVLKIWGIANGISIIFYMVWGLCRYIGTYGVPFKQTSSLWPYRQSTAINALRQCHPVFTCGRAQLRFLFSPYIWIRFDRCSCDHSAHISCLKAVEDEDK